MKEDFKLGLKHWAGTALVAVFAAFVIFILLKGEAVLNSFLKSDSAPANLESGEIFQYQPQRNQDFYESTPAPAISPILTATPAILSKISKTPSPSPTVLPFYTEPTLAPTPSLTPSLTPVPTPTPISTSTPMPSETYSPMPSTTPSGVSAGNVVINEVAWMGTAASQYAEWIELYNTSGNSIDLSDWALFEAGGSTKIISLQGEIAGHGYFLIERTTPSSPDPIIDIAADISGSFGGSGLSNSGENIVLKNSAGDIIDSVNGSDKWFNKGTASPDYKSMERINPGQSGNDLDNWQTNNGLTKNGHDKDGNEIKGTPRQPNSSI